VSDAAPDRPLDDHAAAIMNRWLGNDVEQGEPRQALHRLVETLRVVASELVRVDAEATDLGDLLQVEDLADRLRHAVTDLPRVPTSPARAETPVSHLVERSPVTGASNPIAPPLRLRFGRTTVAHVVFTEQYEGPAGGVHGGMLAAAFDEVLGIAQMAAGAAGYTGTLEVRYLAVTPLHTLVTFEAGVDAREGRKLRMWARATADGTVTAEATGVFVVRDELALPD
jgi:acyl-coenzyme A thioesterase PaaI-like protein